MDLQNLSVLSRPKNLKNLKDYTFDLVVIGGGIIGAGVARDAASRGMSVALIEANDFASGTSSKSSKLIHGGIRYLENLEFKLVFEALSERSILMEMAPHLVHPLRFVLPVYEDSRVGMFKLGLGMMLYDVLALFRTPETHRRLSFDETLQHLPLLQKNKLVGSFSYSDAYMDDDRLVIETLRSAARQGVVCANHVKAIGAEFTAESKKIRGVKVVDQLSGEKWTIMGRHVVSSVGVWTDEVGPLFFKNWEKMLRPSKGIHITLPRERLQLHDAVVMPADRENRIVFGIPRHEMTIVGTTDTEYSGSLDDVTASKADVDYLLGVTKEYFPDAAISRADIIGSYAGIRPLIRDNAEGVGKTSREHQILSNSTGVTFVSGGKYTTYRLISEHVVKKVLSQFPVEDQVRFNHSNTKIPLNPMVTEHSYDEALESVERWSKTFRLSLQETKKLVERHGFEAVEIIKTFKHSTFGLWELEAMQAMHESMCVNLVDFYFRRYPLYLSHPDHGVALLERLANVFAQELHWNSEEKLRQKNLVLMQIKKDSEACI